MNKVILSGNICKDAELRSTKGETMVTTFSLAVNEGFGDKKTTQFVNIVSFKAENVCAYLTKGTKVIICGKIASSNYEKDGVKVYKTEVIADNFGGIELMGKKEGGQAQNSPSQENNEGMEEVSDNDMPFK